MSIRSVCIASVCAALLAAGAAVSGSSAAQTTVATDAAAKGYQALVAGHPEEAIIQYTTAIDSRDLKPGDLAMALLNRALARQGLGQTAQAIDDYSAAMRVDALSPEMRAVALYNRGLAYQALQKRPQAIEDFTSALYLNPQLAQAYHARGNALRESGQYLFALSDYEKAKLYNHPQPYIPVYGEALTYEALGRPAEAKKALEEVLAMKPDFAPARDRLAALNTNGAQGTQTAQAAAPAVPDTQPPAFTPITTGHDPVVTGALGGPDQTVTKDGMPQPVAPPVSLFANTGPIPETVTHAPPVPEIPPAPAQAEAQAQQSQGVQVAALDNGQQTATDASAPAKVSVTETPMPDTETPVASAAPDQPVQDQPTQASTDEPSAQPSGWAVQVSSQRDEQAAWTAWKKLQARHQNLLGQSEAVVVKADLGTKGVVYRLRINALPDKQEASTLCAKLKRAGTSCFVTASGA
ncbi:MAG: tetratricopeptide repeat protein [Hyphomicrobiales bacterium]